MQEKILIIAKPYDAEVMRRTLENAGYQALVSSRGDALSEIIEREFPALVLISLRKDQMGTEELIASIRDGRQGKRVPLVVISDPAGPITSTAKAVTLGVDHLLLRPLDLEQLFQTMATLLSGGAAAAATSGREAMAETSREVVYDTGAVGETSSVVVESGEPQPGDRLAARVVTGVSSVVVESGEPQLGDRLAARVVTGVPSVVVKSGEPQLGDRQAERGVTGHSSVEVEVDHAPQYASGYGTELTQVLPRQGKLGDLDLPQLLYRAHGEGLTGKLILKRGEITKVIFFDDGDLVFASSEQPHDRMSAFLRRQGMISDSQYVELQRIMSGTNERLGSILVRQGWIKPRELSALVRDHVAEIIYSLFSWSEGDYVIDDVDDLFVERIKLERSPLAMILEGVRRKYGLSQLQRLVGPPAVKFRAHPRARAWATRHGFPERVVCVLEQLDGERTLSQLAEVTPLDELGIYQLIYVARLAGWADLAHEQPGAAEMEPLVGLPRDGALDRLRIQNKYAQVCEGTYFNLLGVSPDATGHEVLRAYERLRADFAPGVIIPEIAQECAEQIGEINEVIEEAFRVLGNEALREAYRRSII